MKVKYMISLFSSIFALAFISCAGPSPSAQRQIAPPPDTEVIPQKAAKADWEIEWNQILEKARKEGRLILYTTTSPQVRQALSEGFKKRTGLEIDVVTGRGSEIAQKFLSEKRAGLYMADFYLGGTTTVLTQLKPAGAFRPIMPELFLPEVLDTKLWYKGVLPLMDKEGLVMQTRMMPGGSVMDVAFRPEQVNKAELVSWYDLLNPKLKGKMNMQDPTTAGKGGKWANKAVTYEGLDWDFMRALAKQEPFITRDQRLQIEWVARGRHLIAINPDHDTFNEYVRAGAKLDSSIFKESKDILGGASSGVSLFTDPPHPNAAKLFLNWFLSKEGQTIFSRAYGIQSAREDTPTDHLPEYNIRKPGVEYIIETEEFILQEPRLRPMIVEIFGPLVK